jgi:hypothetical protein
VLITRRLVKKRVDLVNKCEIGVLEFFVSCFKLSSEGEEEGCAFIYFPIICALCHRLVLGVRSLTHGCISFK